MPEINATGYLIPENPEEITPNSNGLVPPWANSLEDLNSTPPKLKEGWSFLGGYNAEDPTKNVVIDPNGNQWVYDPMSKEGGGPENPGSINGGWVKRAPGWNQEIKEPVTRLKDGPNNQQRWLDSNGNVWVFDPNSNQSTRGGRWEGFRNTGRISYDELKSISTENSDHDLVDPLGNVWTHDDGYVGICGFQNKYGQFSPVLSFSEMNNLPKPISGGQ